MGPTVKLVTGGGGNSALFKNSLAQLSKIESGTKPYGIIYKAENLINGKKYIGQTIVPLERRIGHHFQRGSHCKAFHKALTEFGREAFSFSVIDSAMSADSLSNREAYWIAFHDSQVPNGYNIEASSRTTSEASRKKIGDAHRGKTISAATRELIAAARRGTKMSVASSIKKSVAAKGRISPMKGRTHSAQTKEDISTALRVFCNSPAGRDVRSVASRKAWAIRRAAASVSQITLWDQPSY